MVKGPCSCAKASSACLLSFLLFMSFCNQARSSPPSRPLCRKHTFEDITWTPREDQCPLHSCEHGHVCTSAVSEIDGKVLETALTLLKNQNGTYAAVLLYADWCPFSKTLRRLFGDVSSAFPAINHFATESSVLWSSFLSQHGIHSFPALFLLNKTVEVRYFGPRTHKGLVRFYKEVTGFQPVSLNIDGFDGDAFAKKSWEKGKFASNESHLYARAKLLNMWLHDDLYLAFAMTFLMLRLLFHILPKVVTSIRHYWSQNEASRQACIDHLRGVPMVEVEQMGQRGGSFQRSNGKGSRRKIQKEAKEVQKGVLSVPGWPSSSLAAVTIAEGSPSRAGASEDGCESGQNAYKRHLWG